MRDPDRIVVVKGLTKRYGAVEAVRGIDFHVRRGQMFAFLGPNGAGKSTTIDILSTLLTPDSGEVWINGHRLGPDNGAIRAEIGVVFQQNVLDRLLTVRENLQTRARFYAGVRPVDIDAAMDVADVRPFADKPYGKLSGGQRRRADIARALVHTPRLLLLDEPTTGLDPQTRRSVWDTIHTIVSQQDMSVFFSTHYMEEAALADFITIIDGGHIAAEGTPMQLKERYARDSVRLYARDTAAVSAMLRALGHTFDAHGDGVLSVPMQGKDATLALLHHVAPAIDDFEVIHGTMDDVFIQVTGKEVRDG